MIRLTCEQCGHEISVQDKYAGKKVKCAECGNVLVVPAPSASIRFQCQNCGRKIRASGTHAGKKVKCPTCKFILTVPAQTTELPDHPGVVRFTCSSCNRSIEETESSRGKLIPCPHCNAYVAVPSPESSTQKTEVPIQPDRENDESEEHYEQLQIGSIKHFKQPPNFVTERKLPWVLDIFLYPLNMSGMAALAIIVFTRYFFWVTVLVLGEASNQFLPCLAFFGLMWGIGMVVRIVIYMYLCWYLGECVRGSAAGGVRAIEIKGYNAGLGEMFGQTIKVGACLLLYLGPSVIYLKETGKTDAIFWCLFFLGLTFLPMSFLAVTLFESWRGLNPILLIGSIFSTFLPYCAMTLTFIAAGVVIIEKAPHPKSSYSIFFFTWLIGVYLSMAAAHLLGRFYYRYEEKLNWDL